MVTLATEQIPVAANKQLGQRPELIPCACGCGIMILSFSENRPSHKRKFVSGHNNRGRLKGRKMTRDGYWLVLNKDHSTAKIQRGYILEHIKIFEEHYRCCMLSWGIVHHINEVITDNRIANLQGMTNGQHRTLHQTGKKRVPLDRTCCECKSTETRGNWYVVDRKLNGFKCKGCYMRERTKKIISIIPIVS